MQNEGEGKARKGLDHVINACDCAGYIDEIIVQVIDL